MVASPSEDKSANLPTSQETAAAMLNVSTRQPCWLLKLHGFRWSPNGRRLAAFICTLAWPALNVLEAIERERAAELNEHVFHQQLRIVRQRELVAKLEQRDDFCCGPSIRARARTPARTEWLRTEACYCANPKRPAPDLAGGSIMAPI